jgi:hypothetical protein
LVASLTETVSWTRRTIDKVAGVTGRTDIGVYSIIAAVLAIVETTTEGAVGDIAQLTHTVTERVSSETASACRNSNGARGAVRDRACHTATIAQLVTSLAASASWSRGAVGAVGACAGETSWTADEVSGITDTALVGSEAGEAVSNVTNITTATLTAVVDSKALLASSASIVGGASEAVGNVTRKARFLISR